MVYPVVLDADDVRLLALEAGGDEGDVWFPGGVVADRIHGITDTPAGGRKIIRKEFSRLLREHLEGMELHPDEVDAAMTPTWVIDSQRGGSRRWDMIHVPDEHDPHDTEERSRYENRDGEHSLKFPRNRNGMYRVRYKDLMDAAHGAGIDPRRLITHEVKVIDDNWRNRTVNRAKPGIMGATPSEVAKMGVAVAQLCNDLHPQSAAGGVHRTALAVGRSTHAGSDHPYFASPHQWGPVRWWYLIEVLNAPPPRGPAPIQVTKGWLEQVIAPVGGELTVEDSQAYWTGPAAAKHRVNAAIATALQAEGLAIDQARGIAWSTHPPMGPTRQGWKHIRISD